MTKNISIAIVSLGMMLSLSGCTYKQVNPISVDTHYIDETKTAAKTSVRSHIMLMASAGKMGAHVNINSALIQVAEEAKKNDYDYFALLNPGINNIEGFPVTSYPKLLEYCFVPRLKDFEPKCEHLINNTTTTFEALFLKERSPFFPTWSANEVLSRKEAFVRQRATLIKESNYENTNVGVAYAKDSL